MPTCLSWVQTLCQTTPSEQQTQSVSLSAQWTLAFFGFCGPWRLEQGFSWSLNVIIIIIIIVVVVVSWRLWHHSCAVPTNNRTFPCVDWGGPRVLPDLVDPSAEGQPGQRFLASPEFYSSISRDITSPWKWSASFKVHKSHWIRFRCFRNMQVNKNVQKHEYNLRSCTSWRMVTEQRLKFYLVNRYFTAKWLKWVTVCILPSF